MQALEYQGGKIVNVYLNQLPANKCKHRVFLDGGASHNVYYSPEVPDGAVKKEVELAHGTKIGYVKGADFTFVDKTRTLKESNRPTIISLGRLIQQGVKLVWTKDGAHLLLPKKKGVNTGLQ